MKFDMHVKLHKNFKVRIFPSNGKSSLHMIRNIIILLIKKYVKRLLT